MIYVPEQFKDFQFFSYHDNIITAFNSCENSSCTCTDIYLDFDYNSSQNYLCNMNNFVLLENPQITSEVYYRHDLPQIFFIWVVLLIVCIICPLLVVSRMFKRFL